MRPYRYSSSADSRTVDTGKTIGHYPPPVIRLAIQPSLAAGPFVLGSSLYGTLAFLRQPPLSYSLFPDVQVTYDTREPHKSPVRIQPAEGVDLVFAPGSTDAGRLQCIVIQLGRGSDSNKDRREKDDGAETAKHSADKASREQLAASASSITSLPAEAAYRRRLHVTYKGLQLDALTKGGIQKLFGPTYPAKRYLQGDGLHMLLPAKPSSSTGESKGGKVIQKEEQSLRHGRLRWLLSYEGISFIFDIEEDCHGKVSSASSDLSKDARPSHLVLHHGSDPIRPTELKWPACSSEHPKRGATLAGPGLGGLNATSLGLQNTASVKVPLLGQGPSNLVTYRARLLIGKGIDLYVLAPPFPPTDVALPTTVSAALSEAVPPLHCVQLRVAYTSQQDALLELGPPERTWTCGQRTVRNVNLGDHASIAETGIDDCDEEDFFSDWFSQSGKGLDEATDSRAAGGAATPSAGQFWSYPSLGLDLLFEFRPGPERYNETAAVLKKIIVHSDVPGSATWGRFEFVPWYIEMASSRLPSAGSSLSISPKKDFTARRESPPGLHTVSAVRDTAPTRISGASKVSTASSVKSASFGTEAEVATIDTKMDQLEGLLASIWSQTGSVEGWNKSRTRETMHLDRSAEDEFRSLLRLDVRTELRGFPGAVAEVLPLPGNSGRPTKEGETRSSDSVIVGWTIVQAQTETE